MGVKPLFYYPTADGVLFGSEPKAILAHPWVRPRVNKDGLREILVLAKNPEVTAYAGMHEVRPGQVVPCRSMKMPFASGPRKAIVSVIFVMTSRRASTSPS